MISKNSFWVRCRENLKRRGWTVLLCMLAMFLILPVCQAMAVSVDRKEVEKGLVHYMGRFDGPGWVANNFLNAISFDRVLLITTAAFAVLLAIQARFFGKKIYYDLSERNRYLRGMLFLFPSACFCCGGRAGSTYRKNSTVRTGSLFV